MSGNQSPEQQAAYNAQIESSIVEANAQIEFYQGEITNFTTEEAKWRAQANKWPALAGAFNWAANIAHNRLFGAQVELNNALALKQHFIDVVNSLNPVDKSTVPSSAASVSTSTTNVSPGKKPAGQRMN